MSARDRIYVSKSAEVQAIYERLKEEKSEDPKRPPTKPFRFDRDIFLAAAAMGFASKKFVPLESSERKDKFQWGTLLSDEHALPTLRALALAHSSDPEVLLDDDRVASIAEGYANGGIKALDKKLNSDADEIDEAMVFLVETLASLELPEVGDDRGHSEG